MVVQGSTRRQREQGRGLLRAIAIGLLTLLVTAATALGGLNYIWCVPMARAQLAPCCPNGADAHAEHERGLDQLCAVVSDCCQAHRIASLPSTITAPPCDALVPPMPRVALLSLVLFLAMAVAAVEARAPRVRSQPRAGPEPPFFALYCAYLN